LSEIELLKLGFEKDKLPSGKETGKWKMPWGGAIEINENNNIHDIIKKAFFIGVEVGFGQGKKIGIKLFQSKVKSLFNDDPNSI